MKGSRQVGCSRVAGDLTFVTDQHSAVLVPFDISAINARADSIKSWVPSYPGCNIDGDWFAVPPAHTCGALVRGGTSKQVDCCWDCFHVLSSQASTHRMMDCSGGCAGMVAQRKRNFHLRRCAYPTTFSEWCGTFYLSTLGSDWYCMYTVYLYLQSSRSYYRTVLRRTYSNI